MQPADTPVPHDGYTDERAAATVRACGLASAAADRRHMCAILLPPQARETGIDQSIYRGRKMSSVKRFVEASRGNSSAVITRGVKCVVLPPLRRARARRTLDSACCLFRCRDKTAQWRAYDSSECLTLYGMLDETSKFGGAVLRLRCVGMASEQWRARLVDSVCASHATPLHSLSLSRAFPATVCATSCVMTRWR